MTFLRYKFTKIEKIDLWGFFIIFVLFYNIYLDQLKINDLQKRDIFLSEKLVLFSDRIIQLENKILSLENEFTTPPAVVESDLTFYIFTGVTALAVIGVLIVIGSMTYADTKALDSKVDAAGDIAEHLNSEIHSTLTKAMTHNKETAIRFKGTMSETGKTMEILESSTEKLIATNEELTNLVSNASTENVTVLERVIPEVHNTLDAILNILQNTPGSGL